MSYDLMVFAPEAAPKKRPAFLDWYDQQAEWEEDHSYADPAVSTPALQAFYAEIVQTFPAMAQDDEEEDGEEADDADENGDEDEDSRETDYTIGKSLIYISFAWGQIDDAHATVSRLAGKHGLGFFDASSDLAEAWLPDGKGGLYIAHSD